MGIFVKIVKRLKSYLKAHMMGALYKDVKGFIFLDTWISDRIDPTICFVLLDHLDYYLLDPG